MGTFKIVKGDIVNLSVDVIVNAANSQLARGGGVCGAIHAAAGPLMAEECEDLAPCPTGQCRMTGAYNLRFCKKVIHAVGPIWHGGGFHEAELLKSAYQSSMDMAKEAGLTSIAFPFISSNIYGYPKPECARVALEAIMEKLVDFDGEVIMCAFDDSDYRLFLNTYKELMQG